jgi:glycosyltransferase involved in cell wall biosynthesis
VPVVVNYRGGEAAAFLARSGRWVRGSCAAANVLAVPSEFLREIFARHRIASEVLPNVVDLARCRYTARAPRAGAPHLVVTRNLEDIYDVPMALRAFARVRKAVPDARLSIAGSGPELGKLEALARSLAIAEAVAFLGRLDRDAVAALYADADLMLNPSRVDNMPNSVLEGLACGLPVVSTRVGGVPFIVRDGVSALLVDAGDDEAMAAAALRVLRDAALAQRLTQAGLAEVQQYAWARVRPRLSELYERVLPAGETRVRAA